MKYGEEIEVRFYRSGSGKEPVREMLNSLTQTEKKNHRIGSACGSMALSSRNADGATFIFRNF